jgi:hypothetical protein
MKLTTISLAIISIGAAQIASPAQHQSYPDSSFVRFMTGVLLLQGNTSMPNEIKAEKYHELVKITGINADTAVLYLSRLRHTIQGSKELYEQIKKEYSDIQNSHSIPSNEKVKE